VDVEVLRGYFPRMPEQTYDVLIVGGGVIGCSVAHFLSGSDAGVGLRLGVVERDPTYARSSTALSVGGIRQQFSAPENIRMSRFSAEFFREASERLAVAGERPELGFVEAGYLFLATQAGLEVLRKNHSLQTELGAEVQLLDPERLAVRFPWMDTSGLAAGALGIRGEGWLDPYSLLQAFRGRAKADGVEFLPDEVVGFSVDGGRVQRAMLKEGGAVGVGAVVNASGPRAREVAALAGIPDLPVRPRKRTVFRIHCREEIPEAPLTIDPSGVYFRPEGDGFLCGVSPPKDRDPDTLDLVAEDNLFYDVVWPTLARRVPAFSAIKLTSSWAGHYAFNTRDQNAVLGPHPEVANFYFANGFSGHGLQHSPAVGRALSELVLEGRYRTLDLARFGFSRFQSGDLSFEENVI
jgi:sarcosine oxidase